MAKGKKKSEKTAEDTAAEVAERPEVIEPFARFGEWFDDWPTLFSRRFPDLFARGLTELEPIRVEQFTANGDLVIRAEVPGVDLDEDIDVSVSGDQLTISAKREQREESKGDEGYRSEFRYGSFRRTMRLPAGTDASDIAAKYEDGILEVRVPVDAEREAKTKVKVQRKA